MTMPATEPVHRTEPGDAYRPNVGIALFNAQGLVFVGRRCGGADTMAANQAWQMPQGGIDPGESPLEAARRELHEETGVRSVTLLGETEGWLRYDLPEAALKRSWKGRYRGQAQKWFAFGFTGDEAEIDIAQPGGGAHKPEFDAWRWEVLAATPDLIIPFKRPVYERVAAAFAGLTAWQTTWQANRRSSGRASA